jgi:hypothetical protein
MRQNEKDITIGEAASLSKKLFDVLAQQDKSIAADLLALGRVFLASLDFFNSLNIESLEKKHVTGLDHEKMLESIYKLKVEFERFYRDVFKIEFKGKDKPPIN